MAGPPATRTTSFSSSFADRVVTIDMESSVALAPGWQLAFTSVVPLAPADDSARIVSRLGSHHVLEPVPPVAIGAGQRWSVRLAPNHQLRHANDGPASAYVVAADGDIHAATVRPTTTVADRSSPGALQQPLVVASPRSGDPHFRWRGLHLDLARQWIEPGVVDEILELAASLGLNRLHLHLTDDEGWRLPVAGYPQLVRAATRGHGLAVPPMLGGGPQPIGRLYEPDEIGRWVAQADALGVALVPEVDMPAHMHAALAALPHLRDPDDASGARSVQGFVDNVLVPGHPPTDAFVEAVVDSIVTLFPSSPWIHIGGDEVPDDAWSRSPIAARFAAERGARGAHEIAAAFTRDVVRLIRSRTGRHVGVWQEAAESGGVTPDDGYVICWRTVGSARALAEAGYEVVVSPGSAYYLDMAVDDAWESPGASWAGSVALERVCEFEPGRGWPDAARAHLLGVQACMWTEHVRERETLDRLLRPRLDAFAERAWTGRVPALARRRSTP